MTALNALRLGVAAAALVLGTSASALAQAPSSPQPEGARPGVAPTRARLTPAQREKIFPEQRALTIRDHQSRIAILQQGERCVTTARSAENLLACMKAERQANQERFQRHRAEMKSLYEKNGLPAPAWGARKGMGGWGERGGGGQGGGGPAGSI